MGDHSTDKSDYRQAQPQRLGDVFVGRRAELDQIEQVLRATLMGQPRATFIQGDAGIGKTRFLNEILNLTPHWGIQTLIGRCHEKLPLPYLPFVDSLFARLEQALTPQDADVALIHNLCYGSVGSPSVILESSHERDHDKLQLFLAISRATIKLAQQSPTLLIVDDLHWADQPSLDLFAYLVFAIAQKDDLPLCLMGTHRPAESGTQLHRLIDRFERESLYRTVALQGFTESETRDFLQQFNIERPSQQLVSTVHEVTHGMPLFIQQIVHHLVQKGALEKRGGFLVATSSSLASFRLPRHLTEALTARIDLLSQSCRRILTVAAFLSEPFSLPHLQTITGKDEDDILDVLEEGIQQFILTDDEHGFQFAHSIIRQVFYTETSIARRRRIHLQIAQAFEQLDPDNPETHLLEIAHHLIEAGPLADPERLIDYARRAGDRVFELFAWRDAARYYEAALMADTSEGGLSLQGRATLHYQAGLAHHRNQDAGPGLDHYEKAIQAYRSTQELKGLSQALIQRAHIQLTLASVPLGTLIDIEPLQDMLETLGDNEPKLRGRLAAVMAQAYRHARQVNNANDMAKSALDIGHASQDHQICAEAYHALGLAHIGQMEVREARDSWQQASQHAVLTNDPVLQGWPLLQLPLSLTLLGELDEAETLALKGCSATKLTQDWGVYSRAVSHLASISAAKGNFDAVAQYTYETMLMMERSGYPWGAVRSLPASAGAYANCGSWHEALKALDILTAPERVFKNSPGPVFQTFAHIYRHLIHAYSGQSLDNTPEELEKQLRESATSDTYSIAPLCALIEISNLTQRPETTIWAYKTLSKTVERGVFFSTGWIFLIPRVLGLAATLQRKWDQAEHYFLEAQDIASRCGARPELGRTFLDYARMLIAQKDGNRRRAIGLVERALGIFNNLGMMPFVHSAAAVLEALQPTETRLQSPSKSPLITTMGTRISTLHQHSTQQHTRFLA